MMIHDHVRASGIFTACLYDHHDTCPGAQMADTDWPYNEVCRCICHAAVVLALASIFCPRTVQLGEKPCTSCLFSARGVLIHSTEVVGFLRGRNLD